MTVRRLMNVLMWLCILFLVFVAVGSMLGFVHITGIHESHIPAPDGPAA